MTISAGMDHNLYRYFSMPQCSSLEWPDGALIAFAPLVCLEHWPLEPTPQGYTDPRMRDPYGKFVPHYRTYTWREYENRIGIFRLFDVLERYALAVDASAMKRYPQLLAEALGLGWEIAAHGDVADAMVTSRMSRDEEKSLIERCLAALEAATGTRPKGWIAREFSESSRSVELLADAGIEWVGHWPSDDQPYWMTSSPFPFCGRGLVER